MDELIERLRREAAAWDDWNEDHPDDAAVTTPTLLREAAAALEAAREDAERIVFLMPGGRDEPNAADFIEGYRRMIDSARAIDQARGKGGCGEGVGNG